MKPQSAGPHTKLGFNQIYPVLTSALFTVVLIFLGYPQLSSAQNHESEAIRPFTENPMYWQYKGEPLMLIGGTDTDNLFQLLYLEEHLDELKAAGGNYVRNTMAFSREEDVWPYQINDEGQFDLDQFNPEFFERFERLLRMAYERDIIVQVEIWATWNYYMEGGEGYPKRGWNLSPFNPLNNVNYTVEESGLPTEIDYSKSEYPGEHAFFYTRPSELDLEIVRKYQEAFVDKILEIAFQYPNVLYCMNNEVNEAHSWGQYWAQYIQDKAAEKGIDVQTADMYDINALTDPRHRQILDDPVYTFVDISQNNFHTGEVHYELVRYLREYSLEGPKKPLNNTKIYGGVWTYDEGGVDEGAARFMRNLFAGAASMRFHRRDADPYADELRNYYGLGLGDEAKAVIQSTNMLLEEINPWDLEPTYDHFLARYRNEAYFLADPGNTYAVYFQNGGVVELDLREQTGTYTIQWLDVMNSTWADETRVEAGELTEIETPGQGDWVAVIKRR
ncbi:MAG: hypothetical protein U5K72_02500 [Balneolaceae bacterium]|nr:hypothetical protein [Balneolaceae bacterium]